MLFKIQTRYCTPDNLKWDSDHPYGPEREIRRCAEFLTWTSNVDNLSSLVKACSISQSEQNPTGSSGLQCQHYSFRRDLGVKAVS
jgi:hypothetical protein